MATTALAAVPVLPVSLAAAGATAAQQAQRVADFGCRERSVLAAFLADQRRKMLAVPSQCIGQRQQQRGTLGDASGGPIRQRRLRRRGGSKRFGRATQGCAPLDLAAGRVADIEKKPAPWSDRRAH
nr:hypothetical protein [Candidatus Accumulibacter phosphatis]